MTRIDGEIPSVFFFQSIAICRNLSELYSIVHKASLNIKKGIIIKFHMWGFDWALISLGKLGSCGNPEGVKQIILLGLAGIYGVKRIMPRGLEVGSTQSILLIC